MRPRHKAAGNGWHPDPDQAEPFCFNEARHKAAGNNLAPEYGQHLSESRFNEAAA